jgi:hypothetical protein
LQEHDGETARKNDEEPFQSPLGVCHTRLGGAPAIADCTELYPNLRIPGEFDPSPLTGNDEEPFQSPLKEKGQIPQEYEGSDKVQYNRQ